MNNDVMSHEQAVSGQIAERYLLAELSHEERESFEGHYFDCPACFEQVQLGAEFLRHSRDVLDPEPEKGWLARTLGDLWRPAPAFATAMLLLAVGTITFQQGRLANATRPHVETGFFLPGAVKGLEKPIRVSRNLSLSLIVNFKPASEFTSYQAQIISASGQVKYTFPVTARTDEFSATIGLRADALEAGKYSIVIQGLNQNGTPTEVGNGAFDLQFTD